MARQEGVLKFRGSMGGISFYKTAEDGYLARTKGGVDAERIKNDPNFARTRENGAEFGRAGAAGKLLRTALRSLIANASDNRVSNRLTQEMVKAIQADETNARGERNVMDGEVAHLLGFDFNLNAKLRSTFFVPFVAEVDRPGGRTRTNISAFIPNQAFNVPAGATHFRLLSAAAEIDFASETFFISSDDTGELPIDGFEIAASIMENNISVATPLPIFVVLGIDFLQKVNGQFYPLKNGVYNSLSIISASAL